MKSSRKIKRVSMEFVYIYIIIIRSYVMTVAAAFYIISESKQNARKRQSLQQLLMMETQAVPKRRQLRCPSLHTVGVKVSNHIRRNRLNN
jgi:hypothetical protein